MSRTIINVMPLIAVTTADPEGLTGWQIIAVGIDHDSVLRFAKQAIGPAIDAIAQQQHHHIRLVTREEALSLGAYSTRLAKS